MITQIPITTNLYNFELNTVIDSNPWWIKFEWQRRQRLFTLDLGYSATDVLIQGFPVIVNVQINKKILNAIRGSLFFYSENPRISIPQPRELGEDVKLIHYIRDQ